MKRAAISNFFLFISALITLVVCVGCQESQKDLPTKGHTTMMASDDVYPVIKKEVDEFQGMYDQAHVKLLESSARDAVVQLLNDSVKVIAVARDLNDEERDVIKKYSLNVETYKIAYDGAVVLVNEHNILSQITVEQLKKILLGDFKLWSNVGAKGNGSRIVVAIGGPNSGMYEYINARITEGKPFASVIMPCASNEKVIEYVARHSNALGFVAQAYVDSAPPKTRILAVGDPNFKRDSTSPRLEYFQPYQAYIYQKYYPLCRTIYVFRNDPTEGVSLGITAFIAGAAGQKIFLSSGLVPATMPVRLVHIQSQ
ncbi:MAG: substrate-binding domain-containing protein [Bacteroidota bacterium]|nr:substrate-binding domain-containing protein [Bacteroidota bacterium]